MRAGKLDRRITIQRNEPTTSSSGAQRENWVDVADWYAQSVPFKGGERYADQQLVGFGFVTLKLRWATEISELSVLHRFILDGWQYDILDVRETVRREVIEVDGKKRSEQPVGSAPSLDFSLPGNSQYIALLEDV
jgi:SPP1 family predicted phage head-tail adaptor